MIAVLGGLAALGLGGEVLVRGASGLARSFGLSPLVIGLTVVSFTTSAPELAVTLQAALAGNPGLAVGNVVGSNIANVLFILGICAMIVPLTVRSEMVRRDIPVAVAVSVLLLILSAGGTVSPLAGGILLAVLVVYLALSVVISRRRSPAERGASAAAKPRPVAISILMVLIGVGSLVLGALLLVRGATDIAVAIGVSDLVIGLTVVAVGTSLPEFATSLTAVLRGQTDLAVGNIVGSCVFNIGAVLGLTAIITPGGVPVAPAAIRLDMPVMIAVTLALIPVAFTGFTIKRWVGGLFFAYYAAYVVYVLLDASGHDAVEPFSGVMLGFVMPITVLWLAVLVAYELGKRRGAALGAHHPDRRRFTR